MNQGLELTQIQYLMVFLKETPSIGLEAFEQKFIDFASFEQSGSKQTSRYRDHFGEDTKIKTLVTGEIELNEKNILIGLKMAFPEWEFEIFPMNMQKLLLKSSTHARPQEAGIIATIEPTMKLDGPQWVDPCTFDLSQQDTAIDIDSIFDQKMPSEPERTSSDVPRLEEELERFKDLWSKDYYDDESESISSSLSEIEQDLDDQPISPFTEPLSETNDLDYETGYASLNDVLTDFSDPPEELHESIPSLDDDEESIPSLDFDEESIPSLDFDEESIPNLDFDEESIPNLDFDEESIPRLDDDEESFQDSEMLDIHPSQIPAPDPLQPEKVFGADSEEVLEQFGERKSLWPFTDTLAEGENVPSFVAGEFDSDDPFEGTDHLDIDPQDAESLIDEPVLEELPSSSVLTGKDHEFEVLGVVGESSESENVPALDDDRAKGKLENLEAKFKDFSKDIDFQFLNKVKELPIKKIGLLLFTFGVLVGVISFGVMAIEPDYEASRKAAGVVDVYEWIITNDLLREDTGDVFDAWNESDESKQFWAWHDSEWKPKISSFKSIEGVLQKIGAMLAITGILVFGTSLVMRRVKVDDDNENFSTTYAEDKRISIDFTVYNEVWPLVDDWSNKSGFKVIEVEGSRRLYRKPGNASHAPVLCMIAHADEEVEIEVWMTTWIPTKFIPFLADLGIDVLEAKDKVIPHEVKEQINALLKQLGYPPLA